MLPEDFHVADIRSRWVPVRDTVQGPGKEVVSVGQAIPRARVQKCHQGCLCGLDGRQQERHLREHVREHLTVKAVLAAPLVTAGQGVARWVLLERARAVLSTPTPPFERTSERRTEQQGVRRKMCSDTETGSLCGSDRDARDVCELFL